MFLALRLDSAWCRSWRWKLDGHGLVGRGPSHGRKLRQFVAAEALRYRQTFGLRASSYIDALNLKIQLESSMCFCQFLGGRVYVYNFWGFIDFSLTNFVEVLDRGSPFTYSMGKFYFWGNVLFHHWHIWHKVDYLKTYLSKLWVFKIF